MITDQIVVDLRPDAKGRHGRQIAMTTRGTMIDVRIEPGRRRHWWSRRSPALLALFIDGTRINLCRGVVKFKGWPGGYVAIDRPR